MSRLCALGLLGLLMTITAVEAAPPHLERYSALDATSLTSAGDPDALYAPRLLRWPQLDQVGDSLRLKIAGEAERIIYTPDPLYTIGRIYGIAEGDWIICTEKPNQGSSPDPERLVAIWIPRGSIYKFDLPAPLDTRYVYAPRLFGFPDREGEQFHWLALPASGTATFGTVSPTRGIASMTVDGPRLVAKTVDPKTYRGTAALVYVFYGLGTTASGQAALQQVDSRTFPNTFGANYFDAQEAYWAPGWTVLSGENQGAPFIIVTPVAGGEAKGIQGRLLGYREGLLALLDDRDQIKVLSIHLEQAEGESSIRLAQRWEVPLATSATLGTPVWITSATPIGTQLICDLQVQIPGQQYRMDQLGTHTLAVWDMSLKTLVYQLAGQGGRQ